LRIVATDASTPGPVFSEAVSSPLSEAVVSKKFYEIDPVCDPRWGALVDSHPRASVFHSTSWLKVLHAVYGYEPVVVTTCAPGERLTNGLVFCRVNSWLTGRRLVSLPFCDHCEPLVDDQDELDGILIQMTTQVNNNQWKYFEIRPVACQPSSRTELRRFNTYHLHTLNLGLSEEQLFRNFHKDCIQRKIRRAEREHLQYEEGTSEALLKKFYRLVVATRRRQALAPQPLNWFRGLIAAFGNDLKIRIASKNDRPVASILTISHKNVMFYKYGCSDAAFNKLGGTQFLFWKTIQESKARGFEELELGRSDVDNPGLATFKERLGASRRRIDYWSYPRGPAGLPSVWRKRLAGYVVSAVPDIALKMIGKFLYKHVG
jgi:CelD/BcsL family acetyltransferase involved in cellulose biosynthesis